MKKKFFSVCLPIIILVFGFISCGDELTTYTVTFDSNGGSDVAAVTGISSGATITLPAIPTKTGFDFAGWFTDNTTFENYFTVSSPVTSDITVYAKWTPVTTTTYTVTFDSNGGSDVAVVTGISSGATITLPAIPTKTDCDFAGWFTDNTTFQNVFTASSIVTSDITVYAKWDSRYAGTWVSNQYLAQIIVNGDLTFIQQGKDAENDPWKNIAKGNLVISGTNVTMTVTHKYIGDTEGWSDSQSDLESIKGYFGGNLVLTGTVNGSGDGSMMLGHMVKNGTSSYNTGFLTISGLDKYIGKYIFAIAPLASGVNNNQLFAADIFDSDETFSNGLIGDGGAITLNVYQRTNNGDGYSVNGYKGTGADDKIDGRIDILILSKSTLSLTDISDVLPIFMSNPNTTEAEKTAAGESIGLLSLLSHSLENGTPFEDGVYNIGSDWKQVNNGGVFTLKDLPSEYNGKYAVIAENDAGLKVVGAQSVDLSSEEMTGSLISGGTAQIPMWKIDGNETSQYTGSDSGKFGVWIYDQEIIPFIVTDDPELIENVILELTFSNGSAEKSYNDRIVEKDETKVIITADLYQYESTTRFTGSVVEITAFTVNPEDTDEKIKDIGIVGSIEDGVLTIELPTVLDDSFLYTDEEGLLGDPGTKYGRVMFTPYLVLNKDWNDWGNDSGWMGTMPIYIINNDNRGWFYTMNPADYPDDAFTKPISDQDELIADGFYWQLKEE